MDESHVSSEIILLKEKISELGTPQEDGKIGVTFGILFEQTVGYTYVSYMIKYLWGDAYFI